MEVAENDRGCKDVGSGGCRVKLGGPPNEIGFCGVELGLTHTADFVVVRLGELVLQQGDAGAMAACKAFLAECDMLGFPLQMRFLGYLPACMVAAVKAVFRERVESCGAGCVRCSF